MVSIARKPDAWGIVISTLCIVHCFITPLIFIAQSSSMGIFGTMPPWWEAIDYVLLILSFFAVYRSTQITSSQWIKPLFWTSWVMLCLLIINEKMAWIALSEGLVYFAAMALVVLHLYNQKFCQCQTDNCCTNDK